MSNPEARMRMDLVKQFKELHMKPIENSVGIGTPDVCYIDGWLELKILAEWPKRADTVVKFKRYTKEQKLWLRTHWELGGRSFLVLKVGQEWLVWAGADAAVCGSVTRSELESVALLRMDKFNPVFFQITITSSVDRHNFTRRNSGICQRVSELMKNYSFGAAGLDIRNSKPPCSLESPTTNTKTGSEVSRQSLKGLPPGLWESGSCHLKNGA
jgi:hypothetical protein